jgi:hypothetical protein
MILQKFFILALISFLSAFAAPAISESDITTDSTVSTSTSYETQYDTTTPFDTRQNEVDANFPSTTTFSDIDVKIESIEIERSTLKSARSSDSSVDETTTEIKEATEQEKSTEKTSQITETTISNKNFPQPEEDVEEIQEAKNKNEFERFAMDDEKKTTTTTTKGADETSTLQQLLLEEENKNASQALELAERSKTIQQIRSLLKAHILRTILMVKLHQLFS